MKPTAISRFSRLSLTTLIAVYFLILVGGVVRSTGSGMGCPDWPRCFGQWIPPTSVDQLPPDYQASFSALRQKKNEKFARYLTALGMGDTARKILDDPAVRQEEEFNALKTWIEYINRLIGVIIGLFIIALAWRSLAVWKEGRRLTIVAFATLVAVVFQGWLGSIVVSTNLTTWTVTVHMMVAMLIIALLVYLWTRSALRAGRLTYVSAPPATRLLLVAAAVTLTVQLLFGTRVREAIDIVLSAHVPRNQWIDSIWADFLIHRAFSWVVLLTHVGLWLLLRKSNLEPAFRVAVIVLILASLASGAAMAYLGVPAWLQPLHLLLATISLGLLFHVFWRLNTGAASAFHS